MKVNRYLGIVIFVVLVMISLPRTESVYVSELTGSQRKIVDVFGITVDTRDVWISPLDEINYPFDVTEKRLSQTTKILSFTLQNKSYPDVVARQLKYIGKDDIRLLQKTIERELAHGGGLEECKKIVEDVIYER